MNVKQEVKKNSLVDEHGLTFVDYGIGKCIIQKCSNNRLWDHRHRRFMPTCGYDCFMSEDFKALTNAQILELA